MRTRPRHRLALPVALALLGLLAFGGGALAAEQTFTATLTGGDTETPPGDPDGTGSATIVIDVAAGTACWNFTTQNVGPGTQSHIHVGAAGVAGAVVVPLDTDGFEESSEGCIEPMEDAAILQAIVDDPAGYYVNVHTDAYQPGAVRGQLAAAAPNTAVPAPSTPLLVVVGAVLILAAAALGLRSVRVARTRD